MSLSTATRMTPSASANSSAAAGPVLPSFAQTFSDLAASTHARSPPEITANTHSFQSDMDYAAERRDQDRDRERERDRERDRDNRDRDSLRDRSGREQDHSHSHNTDHRSRRQDAVLPPIYSHQDTRPSNSKKRSLDDIRREDDRDPERRQDHTRDDRNTKEGERRSPSQVKREPSLSPSPDQQQHPSHHSRYHQQSTYSYPHHSPNPSHKRRKNNHDLPPSPPNEREAEHSSSYGDSYSHAQRVQAQSNPSSASSSSSNTRTSPPMKRPSAIGSRPNSLSPHQSAANVIHPHASSHNTSRSPNSAHLQPPSISKSPSQSHLRPPAQQPYQSSLLSSHFSMALPAPSDSFSTNRKKKLSAQFQGDISVPVPRPINTGSRSATPTMVTAGSGSGPGSAPGSASGPSLISAPAANPFGSNTNHHHNNNNNNSNNSNSNSNSNIANNIILPSTTTPLSSSSSLQHHPRGPPRQLTIAPHPRTRRLEPVIHSAPVNGGFFHGAGTSHHSRSHRDNMNANSSSFSGGGGGGGGGTGSGGVTIRSIGVSSVRLHAAHASSSNCNNNVEYTSTGGGGGASSSSSASSSSLMASAAAGTTPAASANASAAATSSLHPPPTPMRIPELPPIPITPNGRKSNMNISSSDSTHHLSHSYSRLPPPHSAGLLGRFDKESTERSTMSIGSTGTNNASRFVLDRERLEKDRERILLERDRSERDRGADVPIAKNGGMRSGMVLGSINVPRTPLFSSFGGGQQQQQQAQSSQTHPQPPASAGPGVRFQHGRSVSSKFLQVPHTAGLSMSFSSSSAANGNDATVSSALHTAKQSANAPTAIASTSSSSSSGAAGIPNAATAASSSASASGDPKSSFLTLFSDFYDSLADSKLLKSWLHEQLVKSNTLIEHLEKAAALTATTNANGRATIIGGPSSSTTDPVNSSSSSSATITLTVSQLEDLIERRLGPVKNETEGLKRRVGELEEMVYEARKSGWGTGSTGVDANSNNKKRRRNERHDEDQEASSTTSVPLPVVSIRTSPPPPLVLTPSSSVGGGNSAAAVTIPRAPASAPLLREDRRDTRYLGVPLQDNEDKGDTNLTRFTAEKGSPPLPPARSRSRNGSRTNGHDSTISVSKSLKSGERERERGDNVDDDVNMDERVNRSNDDGNDDEGEPAVTTSMPEHRTSAVRLES